MSRAIGIRPRPDQVADELAIRALPHTWRFVRRTYRYVWLDLKSAIGGDAIG